MIAADKEKIVFVDFDDTLFFTRHTVEEAAKIMLGKELLKEEVRKLPKSIKSKIYDKAFNELYHKATPNFKLIETLKEYKHKGYTIIILTARSEKSKKITEYLLSKYNVPYDRIIVRKDISIKDEEWKLEVINSFNASEVILFEDKMENIEHILQRSKVKIIPYLVSENTIKLVEYQ